MSAAAVSPQRQFSLSPTHTATLSAAQKEALAQRWAGSWQRLCARQSSFGNEVGALANGMFEPSEELFAEMRSAPVLVIGAGGLGCELLKNLALSGFVDLHVIDMDTIDITNLNRQFLFREKDVGGFKAQVAADFIMRRVPGCSVTPYNCAIQAFQPDFYSRFRVVIAGLDNIEARRWLNSTLASLVKIDSDGNPVVETIVPLIDGGTEALAGHARVIIPYCTSCFECSIDLFPPPRQVQLCTIASTPRTPQHCIAYASILAFPREFPDRRIDCDSPEDMNWLYHCALARAKEFGIQGVTYFLTLGVVKSIIPAVASTNAVIAANCVNETIKLLSFCSETINNYFMYIGGQSLNTQTFCLERKSDCPVCGDSSIPRKLEISPTMTLEEFMTMLGEDPQLQLKKPSLLSEKKTLFMQSPETLRKALEGNLAKPMEELVANGEILSVVDPCIPSESVSLLISFRQ